MVYSTFFLKKGKKTIHILSVLSFISVFVAGLFFVSQTAQKQGWQQIKGIEKMYVVNRTPHSFDIVWSAKNTANEAQWVEVGTRQGSYPIKAQAESHEGYFYARVTGLLEKTQYYYRVRVGTSTYILPSLQTNAVKTAPSKSEKPVSPAYGKVILPTNKPYTNGLVIYEIDGFYPLAVFTKSTGEWLLPLTGLIEKKSNTITPVADTTALTIRLFSHPNGVIRTAVAQTRPLKQVIIAGGSVRLAASNNSKNTDNILGVSSELPLSASQVGSTTQIIYPKENALIPGNSPLIRGIAPSGKEVLVLIQGGGKQYSYRTVAGEKGDWVVQSPVALPFGRYSILVTIQNGAGATTIVRRTFSIIKSGEQVLGEATNSPTLVPTVVVPTYSTPTLVPTTSLLPTTVPTESLYPTSVLPTRLVPTASPPVSGGGISNYLFGSLLFIVIGTGLVLAF